ncbi:hypothetical protein GCM10020367_72170 [Streptomyces sannanensis]|uniref:Uncharacterized protein n=1 Tax=Streptomyces sannanensis TaxID=285536 RepID=A0ABP6SQ24_9ACTN
MAGFFDVLVEEHVDAVLCPLIGDGLQPGQDHRAVGGREVAAVIRVIKEWLQHGGHLAPRLLTAEDEPFLETERE